MRSFPAPPTISAEAQSFINDSPVMERFDTSHEALVLIRQQIHADIAPTGRAVQKSLGVTVEESAINGIPVQWITPKQVTSDRVILYFFGGGHITGSPDEDLVITARIAHFSGCKICAPYYRLAPEHPYPAALEDAFAVYTGLLEHHGATSLGLAGESAGANLSLALIAAASKKHLALPKCLAVMSPWCDLTHSGDTINTLDGLDPTLDFAHRLKDMAQCYAGKIPFDSPRISPLFADIAKNFPPTIITSGTRDLLLSDSVRLATKLRKAGIVVDLQVTEGMWHVFEYYADIPEGEDSLKEIAAFFTRHW